MNAVYFLTILLAAAAAPVAHTGLSETRIEMGAPEVSLPMELYGQRPLVSLTIDGHGPYKFILDTGAATTVVDTALADELKLPVAGKSRLQSPAGGEGVESSHLVIGEVKAGEVVFDNVHAQTMDLRGLLKDPEGPRGVFSASQFQGMLVSLDYPNGRIVIRPGELPEADGAEVFQFGSEDGFPTLDVSYGDVIVRSHIDTGSPGGFTLPGSFEKKLKLVSEPMKVGMVKLVGREMAIFGAVLDGEAKIGKYAFPNPEVRFGEYFPVGNIGHGVLKDFELTLDAVNHRVRLTHPAAWKAQASARAGTAPAAPPRRYGMQIRIIDNEILEVAGTDPGSVAEKAGLRAGDKILGMNGKPLSELSSDERTGMLRGSPLALTVERNGEKVEIHMTLGL